MTLNKTSHLSKLLVIVQFTCLALIALTGPLLAENWFLLLELAGISLGVWAIVAMKLPNLNISPEVKPNAELVKRGPYQYIRHPMYTSLLLTTLPLVINYPSFSRSLIWLILLTDLLVKLHHEEKLLQAHFKTYSQYQKESKKLIPSAY